MPSLVFAEGNIFVEVDHYSQIKHHDVGLSMVNVGAENCNKYNFCIEGKVGTPIADNDMKYGETNYIDGFSIGGTSWDTGDLIGGISIKYKLFNWK
jgi:hypothetical protein